MNTKIKALKENHNSLLENSETWTRGRYWIQVLNSFFWVSLLTESTLFMISLRDNPVRQIKEKKLFKKLTFNWDRQLVFYNLMQCRKVLQRIKSHRPIPLSQGLPSSILDLGTWKWWKRGSVPELWERIQYLNKKIELREKSATPGCRRRPWGDLVVPKEPSREARTFLYSQGSIDW